MKVMISPSDINSFFFCPKRWQLENVLGVSPLPEEIPEREFGTVVHEIIAEYYRSLRRYADVTESVAVQLIIATFEKLKVRIRGIREEDWNTVIRNFVAFERTRLRSWKSKHAHLIEEMLEVPPFKGKVDAYFLEDATLVDWKTSKSAFARDRAYEVQGSIYYHLLTSKGYKVDRVLFYFLRHGKLVEIRPVPIERVREDVERMLDMIRRNEFPKRPSSFCSRCPFRLACKFDDMHLFYGIDGEVYL